MEQLVIFCLAVVFFFIPVYIANNKGRSFLLFLALTFIFWPLALLLAICSPDYTQQVEERFPCPRCGESIPTAAAVCRFCSHELTAAPKLTPGPTPGMKVWRAD